jgi:hypothetical protein
VLPSAHLMDNEVSALLGVTHEEHWERTGCYASVDALCDLNMSNRRSNSFINDTCNQGRSPLKASTNPLSNPIKSPNITLAGFKHEGDFPISPKKNQCDLGGEAVGFQSLAHRIKNPERFSTNPLAQTIKERRTTKVWKPKRKR